MKAKPLVETKSEIRRNITRSAKRKLTVEFSKSSGRVWIFEEARYQGCWDINSVTLSKDEARELAEFLRATGGAA